MADQKISSPTDCARTGDPIDMDFSAERIPLADQQPDVAIRKGPGIQDDITIPHGHRFTGIDAQGAEGDISGRTVAGQIDRGGRVTDLDFASA